MTNSRTLSQLPSELLLEIAECLEPHDLLSFMIVFPSLAYIMPRRLVANEDRIGALLHYMANDHGSAEICRRLIPRMEIDVNATPRYTDSYLESAILNQHDVMVDALLARPDIKINGYKADRSVFLKKLLARNDIKVNAHKRRDMTVLAHATMHGYTEAVRLLLEAPGIVIEPEGSTFATPLTLAADAGYYDIVKLLLPLAHHTDATGAPLVDVNAQSWRGKTALIRATLNRHTNVVQLLMKHDQLHVNARDDNGRSALSYAAEVGHLAIMRRLLARPDINMNERDIHRRTPLSYAASGGFFAACKMLVEHPDTEPHAVDATQRTPLTHSVLSGSVKVFRLLLSQCTEREEDLKDHTGRGAWHYANAMKRTKLMKIFMAFKSDKYFGRYTGEIEDFDSEDSEEIEDIDDGDDGHDSDVMDEGED
ncbi:ankyrin [Aspergillus campestris IBT 28561]|uniref:Ankyrin n=1 Tax=Aspergillus campestris (strain IBT 28561) TaxID=1392248 RepID=A0A2I1DCR9_ASPC2|nr:ankyrin [Aspergillus campestris IBT 28561]PKY07661.1 ankyrin [Aspergillus campestris IBT 28561]